MYTVTYKGKSGKVETSQNYDSIESALKFASDNCKGFHLWKNNDSIMLVWLFKKVGCFTTCFTNGGTYHRKLF